MTDFKRDLIAVEYVAGDWNFQMHSGGGWDIFYRTRRYHYASDFSEAISWAKANWRRVEREHDPSEGVPLFPYKSRST